MQQPKSDQIQHQKHYKIKFVELFKDCLSANCEAKVKIPFNFVKFRKIPQNPSKRILQIMFPPLPPVHLNLAEPLML